MSRLRLARIADYLGQSMWVIPAAGLVIAIAAAQILPLVESRIEGMLPGALWPGTGADSARAMLATIAAATMTLTGLVFSVTMLVLQLASNQLSPRVMRTFLADRGNQVVLALFIATFAYALLALREVHTGGERDVVPTLTVWAAFVLALLSVGGFVYYTDHVAQAIRPANVIARVADETAAALERLYPDAFAEPAAEAVPLLSPPDHVIASPFAAGVVTGVDPERLVELATAHGCVVELTAMVGDFVAHGATLFRAWGDLPDEARAALPSTVTVGRERTMRQDPAFGFRQLIDIAERALSTGVNDPTTAVQAIDRLHDLLRRLAGRAIPPAHRVDDDGRLLLILPRPDWDDYVALAVDELRLYGRRSLQVTRRLRYLIEDVTDAAPSPRRVALGRQLALLSTGADIGFDLDADRAAAHLPGRQGHGP